MRNFSLLILLLFIVASCADKPKRLPLSINMTGTDTSCVVMTDIFSIIDTIHLKEGEKSVLSNIKKIEFYDGKYYILDTDGQKCVTVFDESGKYVSSIGRQGKGHGEYTNVIDFCMNKDDKQILILSDNSTVYCYSLTGEFLQSKKLTESILWNVTCNSNGYLFSTNHLTYTEGDNAYLFYFFDKNLRLIGKHTEVLPQQMYFPTTITTPLFTSRDEFVYADIYTSTVYRMDCKTNITDIISLSLNNNMPAEVYSSPERFLQEQTRYNRILDYTLLGNLMLSFYINDMTPRVCIIKDSEEILMDKVFKGIIPTLFHVDDSSFIFAYTPELIIGNGDPDSEEEFPVNDKNNYTLLRCRIAQD